MKRIWIDLNPEKSWTRSQEPVKCATITQKHVDRDARISGGAQKMIGPSDEKSGVQ